MIRPGTDRVAVELSESSEKARTRAERRQRAEATKSVRVKSRAMDAPAMEREGPKHYSGEVVAVGPGSADHSGKARSFPFAVGDEVAFSTYAGETVEVGGESYLVLRFEDVLCALDGEDE